MQKSIILSKIVEIGIIPVAAPSSADDALRALEAIQEGGIPIFEITMTVPGTVNIIGDIVRRSLGDVLVGAGSILDAETARACILAGASFVASPSLDEGTVACCRRYAVPVLPGALTPTEVVRAWQAGADMVKVFPCGAVGGPSYVQALKASLPHVDLVPAGGVNVTNAAEFVRAGASAVGIGAELMDLEAIRGGKGQVLIENARRFLKLVADARA